MPKSVSRIRSEPRSGPSVGFKVGAGVWLVLALWPMLLSSIGLAADGSLERGSFLVASRELNDPNFRETVVLIVEYERGGGALGLIVNRPSEVPLARLLPGVESEQGEQPVFRGGPVEPMQVTLLVRAAEPESAQPAQHVFEDVYFSSSRGLLEWLASAPEAAGRLRTYAGYAGWAPGQLEAEIRVGGWHVMPGDVEAIFEEPSHELWPRLILRGTAEWASLATDPVGVEDRPPSFGSVR